ncbi:MAG TPA: SRPBCC family protein [Mycobacteriales bacterium]|nr:SRPBCC family protein [Mycobacteriales bacterium]
MADQSTQSIVVDAPPPAVMAVIADFDAYPQWAASVKTCEVVRGDPDGRASQVHFVIDAGVVRDDYVLEYDWAPDGQGVSWRLVRGQIQKSQHGSYTLVPGSVPGAPTTVTYSLTVDLWIPMLGMFKRKAEKVIMDTALKELKKRVES